MTYTHEDLELVEKHVAQGEKNVLQQRAIVTELEDRGYLTGEGLETLASLEATLLALRQRRNRILAEVAEVAGESVS